MNQQAFFPGDILLPKEGWDRWAVVACDQFTSQPEYWKQVEDIVGDAPSTYHMIFPEAYLETIPFQEKVDSIHRTMEQYTASDLFDSLENTMIYTERTLQNGTVRKGVVGVLDLEQYDYTRESTSLIRATEGTVVSRLPLRIKVRENALLELPHILILIDDEKQNLIEPLHDKTSQMKPLYDVDLMLQGGNVKGYQMTPEDCGLLAQGLARLAEPKVFEEKYGLPEKKPLVFAVGDGNHSLATAKECYESVKKALPREQALCHPARYALVELNNLHDPSLVFEAIHRAVFDVEPEKFLHELQQYCASRQGNHPPQQFTVLLGGKQETLCIPSPDCTLATGSVQNFLDGYIQAHGGKVDYIHGEEVVRELSQKGAVGILLPAMSKSDLFPTVIQEGALPRKTFSMGEASEKRYYMECRKIR